MSELSSAALVVVNLEQADGSNTELVEPSLASFHNGSSK